MRSSNGHPDVGDTTHGQALLPLYAACVDLGVPFCTQVGHTGPWTEMIAVCRKRENVYIDTSAYTSRRLPPELIAYMKTRSGRRKVLFGTN
jgi:uncharacterized protein